MKNLEWDEEDQPEEGVMWRAQDGSFCAEIREYAGGYMLHLEVDAFNLSHAKAWARRFLEIVCEGDGEVRPLKMAMPEGWNTTPDGPYEGE